MPDSPSRLRIAVVGAGAMGALHARVVAQSQDAELACVVDPDPSRAAELAERYRTRAVPDLDDFRGIDAVIVAAPTHLHEQWALRTLEAGLPTLVEKPLADRLDASRAIVDAATARDLPLMCGLLERFNPAVRTAADIVDAPVHVTTVRHSPYAPRIKTGVAHDLLIHDADLVLQLTKGTPLRIDATFGYYHPDSEPGAEDVAEVTCSLDNGPMASLSVSRLAHRKIRALTITELDRVVEADLLRQDVTVYRHLGNATIDEGQGYRQQTMIDIPAIRDAREPLVAQLEHFVRLTRGELDAHEERESLLPAHALVAEVERIAETSNPEAP